MDGSVLLESFSEFMSGSSVVSVAICHGSKIIIINIVKNNHFIIWILKHFYSFLEITKKFFLCEKKLL
jgi:hypothetical protein